MKGGADTLLDRDGRIRVVILAVSILVSVILAVVLPSVVDGIDFYESSAAIAAPFVVLGIWDMLVRGRWIPLGISAVVSVVLYLLDWRFGAVSAMLLMGSVGVASAVDLASRRFALTVLESVEHGRTRPAPTVMDRVMLFLFDVPPGLDARNMRMNRTIVRDRAPLGQALMSMIPALVLMTFLWMFVTANVGFRSDVGDNSMLAVAVSMYIAAASLLSFSIATMDVRIEHAGATFRLFDGLIGTAKRMAVPALLALVILLYAADPGWNAVSLIVISAVFCVALMLLSLAVRIMSDEATFVEDVSKGWSAGHPVDFYAGFDGRDGRHPLNDGVPGTPVRQAESCFDPQRKN